MGNGKIKIPEIGQLLPCPFCGYEHPRLKEGDEWPGRYTVYCPGCGARIGDDDEWGTDEFEARDLWNQRQNIIF